jgi:SAM-dependent methyltransferase
MTAGSPSLEHPDYWWYVARERLLGAFFGPYVEAGGLMLDVGSADGPSVSWVDETVRRISMDIDPRGLTPGDSVCADLARLPFGADTFDTAGAFDVLEHCEDELAALAELRRVLRPGGLLLVAVPAYTWAWTSHDDHNAHLRRYTRGRLEARLVESGFEVLRSSYAFAGVFPFFAAHRVGLRLADSMRSRSGGPQDVVAVPRVPGAGARLLLGLSRADERLLRHTDLPFGSSVFVVAVKRD